MKKDDVLFFAAVIALAIFVFCTGCNAKLKRTEYFIDGEWVRCDYISTEACGETLRCGETLHVCQTNIEKRNR